MFLFQNLILLSKKHKFPPRYLDMTFLLNETNFLHLIGVYLVEAELPNRFVCSRFIGLVALIRIFFVL